MTLILALKDDIELEAEKRNSGVLHRKKSKGMKIWNSMAYVQGMIEIT